VGCSKCGRITGCLLLTTLKISLGEAFGRFVFLTRLMFLLGWWLKGKILSLDNLRCRRIWVLDWCFMCKRAGESVNHLMIHCEYAWELWSMIFCLFGVSWAILQTTYDLLHCWRRKGPAYVVWNAIPSCLMWLVAGEEPTGVRRC
jgi:hypothetical protein